MRLLSDAKYLHSRLSALKNVGVLSNMLEIVVQEKRLPGAKVPSSPSYLPPPRPHSPRQPSSSPLSNPNHNQHQQPPNQNQAQSQQKATTSQRLKGLLSRSTSGSWGANFPPAKEKETPNPNPNSANANGNGNAEASPRASSSSIRDGSELKRSASGSGFRHFEAPGSPLPPLPPTPSALAARGSSELLPPGGGATSPNPLSVTPSPSPSPAPPPPPPEKEKGKDEDEDGQGQVLEGQGEGEGETRLEASYGPENGGVESKEMDTDMDKNTQQTLTEEAVTVPSPPGEGREESQPIQS
ncbi:hypothetical protein V5O48_018710 [Marasmius crinis-equi]|uniref:Uncharacterized protein n=1 Tax=Marasmius crinis-equi TaxID=585013 RepID=A0ABR3EKI1_9AGAR